MDKKLCSRCKEEKPISEFGNNRSEPDGLQHYCKKCWSEYMKEYTKTRNQIKRIQLTKLEYSGTRFTCIGFLFQDRPTKADVLVRYKFRRWQLPELIKELESGLLPSGMILQTNKNEILVLDRSRRIKHLHQVIKPAKHTVDKERNTVSIFY